MKQFKKLCRQTIYKKNSQKRNEQFPILLATTQSFLMILFFHTVCCGQICSLPFGSNNPYASSQDSTAEWLNDLNVCWISDHIPRAKIEKDSSGYIVYDFTEIDPKLAEYGSQANANSWFIINIESKFQFTDGREIGTTGKYLPTGDTSYFYYEKFLDTLVKYVNSKVPSWKARYWSADNEHASLYITSFCSGNIDSICGDSAAQEYANLLKHTWNKIKAIDTNAKIVYGGIGGGTPDDEYYFYYIPSLTKLFAQNTNGYFDFFDFHDFNVFKEYKTNSRGKGLIYFKTILQNAGFTNKSVIMKAGATHSGIDTCATNNRLHEGQSEHEQSEYLFKRFIWNIANGAELILYGDIREDTALHDTYSLNGLMYNGIPDITYCNAQICDTDYFKPCPDPGDGIKKLSYFTFKFLNNKMQNYDWSNIDTISNGNNDVYIYKLLNTSTSDTVWIAWWDYWNDTTISAKNISLYVGSSWTSSKITDAIPDVVSGMQLNPALYPSFFADTILSVINDSVYLTLQKSPLFIEKDFGLKIKKQEKNTFCKIYPNPFSTQTVLQTNNPLKNATLTIYSSFGQTIKQIKNINGQIFTLQRDNLQSGFYFVWLTVGSKVITIKKLVIID